MASHATTTPSAPRSGGVGPVRRLAGSIVRRPWARPDVAVRLRGALPLRYPFDSSDPFADATSGLGSQRAFVTALEQRAERGRRDGTPYSLLLIDVDMLAQVNARFGPLAGDQLIGRLAGILRDAARSDVRSFRIGSDEYAVLMTGAGPAEALAFARTALAALEDPSHDEQAGTFSAGVASAPSASRDPSDLYRMAWAALAWVKRHGRSSTAVFDPETHGSLVVTETWQADFVEKVLSARHLRPVFQPIVEMHTGRIVGYEGLVRTDAAQAGMSTRELFAAAAATGRAAQLDLACLEVVVRAARRASPNQSLSLNLSARTLAGREFEAGWLIHSLVEAGISPRRVVVEVSNGEPIHDLERLDHTLAELRGSGLRVAADDVNADDPDQRLLRHVPFDIVKIDLTQMWEGAKSGPVLAMLRDTALSRHAHVVAEGLETPEQFLAVRDLEIGVAQGYLLARPDASLDDRLIDVRRIETEAEAEGPFPAAALPMALNVEPIEVAPDDEVVRERLAALLPPAAGAPSAVAGTA